MPIKYIPFIPEPIEGQAVLGNFNRILKYKGADEVSMTLQRGMPLYEMEKVETVGENADGNMVIRGECVSACAYLKSQGIQVDLVYIDPPFASGADYAKQVYIRRNPKVAEAIAQAEQELDIDELKAFEEKMYGDVWDKEKYLNWMYENLIAIKSIMSENASIYLHLDYRMIHYVKILMDEIFGDDNFESELVWKKTTKTTNFNSYGSEHDTILYYSNNYDDVVFNQAYTTLKESELLTKYIYLEKPNGEIIKLSKEQREGKIPLPEGRRFRGVPLLNMNQNRPNLRYEFLGHTYVWAAKKEKLTKMYEEGLIFQINGGMPQKKGYLDENKGAKVNDIWTDISAVNSQAIEKEDYATQKPEALLDRILKVSSNRGMIVADFFGGSGVTAAVAHKLGRKFIHCDIGINSIQTTRDRLKADGAEFDVLEIKDGVQLYRNPVQTMNKIQSLIPGLKNEDSLDSFWEGAISDSKLGTIPVYVPNLMDSSTKLLDVVLMNRIIHQAIPDLDHNIKKVIVYYIDITDEAEIRKFIADDDSTTVEIELRDLKAILDDVVIGDYVEFRCEENTDTLLGGYAITIDKFISDRVMSKIAEFNNKAMLNSSEKKPYKPIIISDEGLELIEFISVDCTSTEGEWHSDSEIKIDKLGYVVRNGAKTKEFWDCRITSDNKPLRIKIRNICGDETVWEV
jgi:adenine-specific DNA-methyltransferase